MPLALQNKPPTKTQTAQTSTVTPLLLCVSLPSVLTQGDPQPLSSQIWFLSQVISGVQSTLTKPIHKKNWVKVIGFDRVSVLPMLCQKRYICNCREIISYDRSNYLVIYISLFTKLSKVCYLAPLARTERKCLTEALMALSSPRTSALSLCAM